LRPVAGLLALLMTTLQAGASPLCKDLSVRGKPVCPAETTAVCTIRTYCLTSQFPVIGSQVCEAWVCKPIAEGQPKSEPPK